MIIKNLAKFSVLFLLASCSSESDNRSLTKPNSNSQFEKLDIVFSDILSFSLDSITSNESDYVQYFENGEQELLGYLNKYDNSISIFDIKKKKKLKVLKIPEEFMSKHNIRRFLGFHFYDLENAILIPKMRKKIILADFLKGDFVNFSYEEISEQSEWPIPFPRASYMNPVIILDSSYYMTVYPDGNWNAIDNIDTRPVCYQVDLTGTNNPDFLHLTYPVNYYEDGPTQPYFSQCFNGQNEFVYSFFADDIIYVADERHTRWREISAPSRLRGDFLKVKLNPTMDEYLKFHIETAAYLWITYDKYRKCYYRLVAVGSEFDPKKDLMKQVNFRKLSLMVLNEKLEVVNETMLENRFNYKNYFVGTEGLYLSLSNPVNDSYEEDQLKFQLIELKK
jgi:hypothetical protein